MKLWFSKRRTPVASRAEVERGLKDSLSKQEPPAGFSDELMRAIRSAERPTHARPAPPTGHWLAAPSLTAVLILALAWFWGPPAHRPAPELDAASAGLDLGVTMARGLPSSVVEPLSQEWLRLDQDLDRTAEFVLASLP